MENKDISKEQMNMEICNSGKYSRESKTVTMFGTFAMQGILNQMDGEMISRKLTNVFGSHINPIKDF